jgi:YbbR domain-containing protein
VLASVEPARGDSTIRGAFALIAQDEERQTVPGVRVEPARALVRMELVQAMATRPLLVSAVPTGQEAPGYQVYDAQVEPRTVLVAGLQDRLAVLPGLTVLADVQGLRENATRQATPVLPAGVRFAPGASGRVTIRLRVRPLPRGEGGSSVPVNPAPGGSGDAPATPGAANPAPAGAVPPSPSGAAAPVAPVAR